MRNFVFFLEISKLTNSRTQTVSNDIARNN